MTQTEATRAPDTIDALAGIAAGSPLFALRTRRAEVARFAEASYQALLAPADPAGLSLAERHLVALRVTELSGGGPAAEHYRGRLRNLGVGADTITAAGQTLAGPALGPRLTALLRHADRLTLSPHATGAAELAPLQSAGLAAREIVSLAQLITFVTFQVRVLASLRLLGGESLAAGHVTPDPGGTTLNHPGFTLEAVDWRSYVPTVDPAQATPEQLAVLDESSPQGRSSQYYLLLVHDVDALRARSRLFKAVMYGPGGVARSDRELASVATSRVNGCVYCASVHSRLYAQLTKRPETMQRIFDEGVTTQLPARERAVVDYAVALTRDATGASADLGPLRAAGLSDHEILDVTHVVAMFAWANRLLQTLGAVVRQ